MVLLPSHRRSEEFPTLQAMRKFAIVFRLLGPAHEKAPVAHRHCHPSKLPVKNFFSKIVST